MRQGKLAVVSGFSGVGKGTVVKELLRRYPSYALSVSATTRDRRPGEIPDVTYHYLTTQEFEAQIAAGGFLEWAKYVDHYYGTPKPFVVEEMAKGHDVILEIESEGGRKVKALMRDTLLIFMLPPSMKELHTRLKRRGTESEQVMEKRLKKAVCEELPAARSYDFLLVNRDVGECAEQLNAIIRTGKGLRPWTSDLLDRLECERNF